MINNNRLVAIDLFSGGGGLTHGLKEAGFLVSAAVELDAVAAETYTANNPNTVLFTKDIRGVLGEELLATSPTGRIDLIAACPPCQSFSSLTAKYKKKDPRDKLIDEFARIVEFIMPSTIMMENVPGLARKGKELFEPVMEKFKKLGYKLDYNVLEVADYGVPQRRKRLVVLGSLVDEIKIPSPTHSEMPKAGSDTLRWVTVKEALCGVSEPLLLSEAKKIGGPNSVNWNVIRDISEINKERFRHLKEGEDRFSLPVHLLSKCHLDNKGFSNVYGRMAWDKPSPTITGGCTTPSKGRFGHPERINTISVREAAMLQTFPDEFKISTSFIDRACLIIGNALPPLFAKVMAKACYESLRREQLNAK